MDRAGTAQAKGDGSGKRDGSEGNAALSIRVYRKLLEVPSGQVTTYGDLARAVGVPNGQRAVGRIMNQNPFPVIVPCHRVVRSDGDLGGYAYGADVKARMLSREGLVIDGRRVGKFGEIRHRF